MLGKMIKAVFAKSFILGILFVVLLLLPMSWPIIILIMTLSFLASFFPRTKNSSNKDYFL